MTLTAMPSELPAGRKHPFYLKDAEPFVPQGIDSGGPELSRFPSERALVGVPHQW